MLTNSAPFPLLLNAFQTLGLLSWQQSDWRQDWSGHQRRPNSHPGPRPFWAAFAVTNMNRRFLAVAALVMAPASSDNQTIGSQAEWSWPCQSTSLSSARTVLWARRWRALPRRARRTHAPG